MRGGVHVNGLTRNMRRFYYSYPSSGTDEYGNPVNNVYCNPIEAYANISAAKGNAELYMFGTVPSFDRVINPAPSAMPKRTDLHLWIDTMPVLVAGATTTKHDYIVTQIADGLNNNAYAVKKVSL